MFEVCVLWVFMCSGFREQVQNCFFTQGIPDAVISKPKAGLVNSASQLMEHYDNFMSGSYLL